MLIPWALQIHSTFHFKKSFSTFRQIAIIRTQYEVEVCPGAVIYTNSVFLGVDNISITTHVTYTLRWQQAQPQQVEDPDNETVSDTVGDRKLWKLKQREFKQPPKMCDDEEKKLANFKDDVLAAYTKHKPPTSKMTKKE